MNMQEGRWIGGRLSGHMHICVGGGGEARMAQWYSIGLVLERSQA